MMNKKLLVTVFVMSISVSDTLFALERGPQYSFPPINGGENDDVGYYTRTYPVVDLYGPQTQQQAAEAEKQAKILAEQIKQDSLLQSVKQKVSENLQDLGRLYLEEIAVPQRASVSEQCATLLVEYDKANTKFHGEDFQTALKLKQECTTDNLPFSDLNCVAGKQGGRKSSLILSVTDLGTKPPPQNITLPNNGTGKAYDDLIKCDHLDALAKKENKDGLMSSNIRQDDTMKSSMPGEGVVIQCKKPAEFTIDYDECLTAIKLFNVVVIADQAMILEQGIRRDVKNKNIQEDANAKAAKGDGQNAAIDAMNATKDHENSLLTEKTIAYGSAVTALIVQYNKLPGKDDAIDVCKSLNPEGSPDDRCDRTVTDYRRTILANEEGAKSALAGAIMKYSAKAAAAGLSIDKNMQAQAALAKIKNQYDDAPDMMLELCEYNPADPACTQRGPRVSGSGAMANGGLSFGGDGTSNSFDMNPAGAAFGEAGADTNLADDKNQVASINSPFKDAANEAKGILSPASEAKVQATGGAGGGSGGGGGGGGGGGSASLGGDLKGAQKEPSGDPQVKAGKVSGSYSAAGGGGYKGIGKGKEDKSNPFSSLFDQKGAAGGVEEDRTIASGDIDGKASGLFEKISSRYSKIKADKRIEAQNLE